MSFDPTKAVKHTSASIDWGKLEASHTVGINVAKEQQNIEVAIKTSCFV